MGSYFPKGGAGDAVNAASRSGDDGSAESPIPRAGLPDHQEEQAGKSRITIRVDNDVLAAFKARAAQTGGNYQTMMNDALKQFAQGLTLSEVIRQAIFDTFESLVRRRSKTVKRLLG